MISCIYLKCLQLADQFIETVDNLASVDNATLLRSQYDTSSPSRLAGVARLEMIVAVHVTDVLGSNPVADDRASVLIES